MDALADLPSLIAAAVSADGEVTGTVGGLLFYISVALVFSFLCSILEAGLLSIPPSYVETQAQDGNRAARLMQKHKLNVDVPITAILTLNTIAHTLGAANAGAEAVGVFGSQFLGVITAVLTFLILVFSEIIPKTLGAVYWKQLFSFTAYAVQVLVIVLYPIVMALQLVTRLITPDEKGATVTRGEIEMMASIGEIEGALKKDEGRMLKNILNLGKVQVGDIMTPRTVLLALQQDTTVAEVLKDYPVLHYSRIPIFEDNVDDITGFVLRYDILKRAAADQHDTPLRDLKLDIHPVPETLPVSSVLNEFMTRQQHIFLVFDEYGGTSGIVTLEDAVESLLGLEITDESDLVADMRKLAEQRYLRQYTLLNRVVQQSANGTSQLVKKPEKPEQKPEPDSTDAESA